MPEYYHVEKPFLDHLHLLWGTLIDHGPNYIPTDRTTC